MKYFASILAAAICLAVLALPTAALAQCNCPSASLLQTPISATYSTTAGAGPTLTSNASFLMDHPSSGPSFGMGGNAQRLNLDYGPNTIRLDFGPQAHIYAPGTRFTFTNLFPKVQSGWPGTCTSVPEITGMTVQTTAGAAAFVNAGTTFTAHSLTVPLAGSTAFQWNPGDFILVTFSFDCPAAGTSTCCPPLNNARLRSLLSYVGTGGVGALYHVRYTPTAQAVSQMNAYFAYLQSQNPNINSYGVEFQLFNGGTGPVSVPTGGPLWATYNGFNTPWTFFPLGLNANQWYRVRARILFSTSPMGHYQPPNCPDAFIDIRFQAP